MNYFKKAGGVVALLLSVVFVVCALGSYQDVRADGPSDTVAIYNADKDGANIGIIGKGYAPNTTFKVTVTFSATVNISSSWNGTATSNGSTVTFEVTADGNGEYNVGMYMTGNYEGLSVLSKSSTGSAPKAEPAKPAPEKKDPEQEKPAPEPPADKPEDKKPEEKKPEEKKPEEKKPEEKKAEEKKAEENKPEEKKPEEKKQEENKPDPEKKVEEEKTPAKQEDKNGNKDTKKDDSKASGDQAKADDKSSAATAAVSAGTTDKTKDTDAVSEPVKEETNAVTGEEEPVENEVQEEAFTEEGDAKDEEEIPVTSDDDGTKKDDKAPAAVKNEEGENEGEVTEEPTPELLSKTSVSGVIRANTKKKSGGWWTFLLILVIIGVCVRFAKMKMDGVDNSDLLKEFIPVKAIRNRFGSSKTPVPEAEAPVTVNGYLKKSDTASIRPVYSNTASGSASRVRGEAKTGTNKTAFNQAQAMKELHAMREGNDGGAKAPGQE